MGMKVLFLLICSSVVPTLCQVISLEQYNIDPNTVTISGLSSGACFATQYHVVHSAQVKGAAMFAGVVYYCAEGSMVTSLRCTLAPSLTSVPSLVDTANSFAAQGLIDPVANMDGTPVYIFQGLNDTIVLPENGVKMQEFYQAYNANLFPVFFQNAEHCQPTDYYGPECLYYGGEYINNCNYNGAFEAVNFLYGNSLVREDETFPLLGTFSEFSQQEFFPSSSPTNVSIDDIGFIYIPSGCIDKTQTCKLHVVFHGCLQGRVYLSDSFAKNTGYLPVAEANNIITLFPQASPAPFLNNPEGCWDWYGYNDKLNYATNEGVQVRGIYGMIDRLVNGN